jgi:hypothetical protein
VAEPEQVVHRELGAEHVVDADAALVRARTAVVKPARRLGVLASARRIGEHTFA